MQHQLDPQSESIRVQIGSGSNHGIYLVEAAEVAETRQSEDGSSNEEEAGQEEDAASSSYYSVEPSAFDNLDWDVECPAQVWKLLR